MDNFSKIFPTAPGLDQDLGSVGMLLDSCDKEITESMEFSDYYPNIGRSQAGESGDLTPVSGGSEVEFNTNDATAGSSSIAELDVTVIEDVEISSTMEGEEEEETIDPNETLTSARLNALSNIFTAHTSPNIVENNLFQPVTPKLISPLNTNVNICTNVLHSPTGNYNLKHIENTDRVQPSTSQIINELDKKDLKNIIKQSNVYEKEIPNLSINLAMPGSDKWTTSKEKFLDNKGYNKTDNVDFGKNLNTNTEKKVEKESKLTKTKPGAVVIKESYIEPPRISRVSRSFHRKSPASTSYLDISLSPRRASDGPPTGRNSEVPLNLQECQSVSSEKSKLLKRPQFMTQMSQPCGSSLKFSSLQPRKTSLTEAVNKSQRFTTTRVDEAEHAVSVGMSFTPRVSGELQDVVASQGSAVLMSCDEKDTFCFPLRSRRDKNSSDNSDNVKITKSKKDKSVVTHGFNIEK